MNYTEIIKQIEKEIKQEREVKLIGESQKMIGDLGIEVFKWALV